jgi:hypothetical protein
MTYDDRHNDDRPERPRAEPEIIPPDRSGRQHDWRNPPWYGDAFTGARGTRRVYIGRVGPFGVVLLMLAIAAIVALAVIAVVGVALIWIPLIAVIIAAGALSRLLRGFGSR